MVKERIVTVRVEPEIKVALELLAASERRTLSNLVGVILEKYVVDLIKTGQHPALGDLIRHTHPRLASEMAAERGKEGLLSEITRGLFAGMTMPQPEPVKGDPGLLNKLIPPRTEKAGKKR
jgi:hypothetical protein